MLSGCLVTILGYSDYPNDALENLYADAVELQQLAAGQQLGRELQRPPISPLLIGHPTPRSHPAWLPLLPLAMLQPGTLLRLASTNLDAGRNLPRADALLARSPFSEAVA